MADAKAAPQPYTGLTLAFLTFVLSMANVMEVLDLTIANSPSRPSPATWALRPARAHG